MIPAAHWRPVHRILAFVFFFTACTSSPVVNIAISDKSRETNPILQQDELHSLIEGNNTFAVDLYQSLHSEAGNLIFSPYSISEALAMTYAGARGETETELANVLHFVLPQSQLHPAFNSLDLDLTEVVQTADKDQEPLQLKIANAIWAEQTYPFLPEFLDRIALNYGAGIHLADFRNAHERARREINGWVEDQTDDKIRDLVPEGALDELTRMVLVNAIYFKADWLDPFDKESTRDGSFHLLDGSVVETPMMSQPMYHVPYADGDGFQAIELKYAGNTAAMDIIVPDDGRFAEFETALKNSVLAGILENLQEVSIQISMPKFNFTSEFNLSDRLKELGMPAAFDPERADFTGMSDARELYISDVLHKSFVVVDEKGTEAAAVTAVIMGVTSMPMFEFSLDIDRPFLILIRDLETGQILFMGRVVNPRL